MKLYCDTFLSSLTLFLKGCLCAAGMFLHTLMLGRREGAFGLAHFVWRAVGDDDELTGFFGNPDAARDPRLARSSRQSPPRLPALYLRSGQVHRDDLASLVSRSNAQGEMRTRRPLSQPPVRVVLVCRARFPGDGPSLARTLPNALVLDRQRHAWQQHHPPAVAGLGEPILKTDLTAQVTKCGRNRQASGMVWQYTMLPWPAAVVRDPGFIQVDVGDLTCGQRHGDSWSGGASFSLPPLLVPGTGLTMDGSLDQIRSP